MPRVYDIEYEPISGGFHAYSSTKRPPACGPERGTYQEWKGNAFYCYPDDLVAWDEEELIPELYNEFGQYTVAFVFAHEWGHAIQKRSGLHAKNPPTILKELQADCFAGAYSKHLLEADGDLKIQIADLQLMMAGGLKFADPVGSEAMRQGAHGSGFDRVSAMQDGFENGASRCASYEHTQLSVFQIPFNDVEDAASKGNAPYDDILITASKDLNEYWSDIAASIDSPWEPIAEIVPYSSDAGDYPTCGTKQLTRDEAVDAVFYCEPDNVVYYDDDFTRAVYDELGDFGLMTLFAHQWAVSVQMQSGKKEADLYTSLQESCFTGTWAASIARGDRNTPDDYLLLSPGDLDEGIAAFLAFSERPDEKGNTKTGSAFQRIQAFRDGFLTGASDRKRGLEGEKLCAAYTEEQADAKDTPTEGGTGKR
ncbi:MAG: neutral zinc metallopeptidase [Acidimicrobiales bacterium]|nr:neutral zinc metallopeptidase [Acidimicrobiales bacterium]